MPTRSVPTTQGFTASATVKPLPHLFLMVRVVVGAAPLVARFIQTIPKCDSAFPSKGTFEVPRRKEAWARIGSDQNKSPATLHGNGGAYRTATNRTLRELLKDRLGKRDSGPAFSPANLLTEARQ